MASSRLFTLVGPSFLRNYSYCAGILPIFDKVCCNPAPRFRCFSSSALSLNSDASTLTTDDSSAVSAHPWPEWVKFVDQLKDKGYFATAVSENGGGANNEGVSVYTDATVLKDVLNFGRDRFDIFDSLPAQDIQTIVEKGCPNLYRKVVNSSKRLRAYVKLNEGDVCSSCVLRGSCDKANVVLKDSEAVPRTLDVVRLLLHYALDRVDFPEEIKPPGRELIESSARKLLSELIELGDTPRDPDLPNPASSTLQRQKPSDISDSESSKNVDKKLGDWVCVKCNFLNSAKSRQCEGCGYEASRARRNDREMKAGDWICPRCKFMNFARNAHCLKCTAERPADVSFGMPEKKKGDWDCPRCSFLNFAKNRQCFRCQEPRSPRELRPGDWECPKCDFLNFSRNEVCKKCNIDRPVLSSMLDNDNEQTWKRPC